MEKVALTDPKAPERKRRGRPPKANKRVPLHLLISPQIRSRLVAMAEENGRSITQQVELLLEHALRHSSRSAFPPPSAERPHSRVRRQEQYALWINLEAVFGPQIAGLLFVMGIAMGRTELATRIWSRNAAERTRQFQARKAGEGATHRQMERLEISLQASAPSGEEPWLSDDSYVFGQVANSARFVLETLAPEGDPSVLPPLPRGMDPQFLEYLLRELGKIHSSAFLREITSDEKLLPLVDWLGERVIARLRDRLGPPPQFEPQNGEK